MNHHILIACASQKLDRKAKASELYTSPLFKKSLIYARSLKPDNLFILSAKYGLIHETEIIDPYDLTLNKMPKKERQKWAIQVLSELERKTNLEKDLFTILAGKKYREFLIPEMSHYEIPLEGLGIGKQLNWLTQ